jgi:serine/threonine protein phosphatase 1
VSDDQKFAILHPTERCWAVAAVHGEAARLRELHGRLGQRFRPGDNLIYLGNVLGRGAHIAETVDEALSFRRSVLARPGVFADDIHFLRGAQEEMWHKLLQIQFARNPAEILRWMSDQGIGATLAAYGGRIEDGLDAGMQGAVALTAWTSRLRAAMRGRQGHNAFMSALRRAAFTADDTLLFVHAGIDPDRPLSEQADSFWWGGYDFERADFRYGSFRRVVRGFDSRNRGVEIGSVTATIDGGCGQGGPLVAACFGAGGEVLEMIEA